MLEDQENDDLVLFEKIKNNPKPDINDLWFLSPKRFIEWRKLNDFPILLSHFDKTLVLFHEWKQENKLTNEIIIENGVLTPFFENKKLAKDKTLYLTKQSYENVTKTFVGNEKIEGEKTHSGKVYKYEIIQSFISYLDWLNLKGKTENILNINARHGPDSDYEKVLYMLTYMLQNQISSYSKWAEFQFP